MKKLFTGIALALTLCFSLSTAFAAPSVTKNGAVKSDSITIDGKKVEDVKAGFTEEFENVPAKQESIIEKVNSTPSTLADALKDEKVEGVSDLSEFKLLSSIQDLSLTDANGKPLEGQENVTVTWEVPNLATNVGTVKVLHFSTVRNVWEVLTPSKVDFTNKTVTQSFPDLSPVAVIYEAQTAGSTSGTTDKVETGDSTNVMTFAAVAVVALAGIGYFVVKSKKA